MKIHSVELKEINFIETNGKFEKVFTNIKKHPVFLTNAAVKKGYDTGLLESSLFEDLLKIKGLETLISQKDEKDSLELMNAFNEQKMIAVVYLGVVGANKNFECTFDEFLDLYHYPFVETVKLYANLITGLLAESNDFAKALQKESKKNKKKQHHKNTYQNSSSHK